MDDLRAEEWRGSRHDLAAWRLPAIPWTELAPAVTMAIGIPIMLHGKQSGYVQLVIWTYVFVFYAALWAHGRRSEHYKRKLEARFGADPDAVHVHVEYAKYDPYGEDVGILFTENGRLAFHGVVSSWTLPPQSLRHTGTGVLDVATSRGVRELRFKALTAQGDVETVLAEAMRLPPAPGEARIPWRPIPYGDPGDERPAKSDDARIARRSAINEGR